MLHQLGHLHWRLERLFQDSAVMWLVSWFRLWAEGFGDFFVGWWPASKSKSPKRTRRDLYRFSYRSLRSHTASTQACPDSRDGWTSTPTSFHRLGASTSGLHPDGILRPAQQRVRSHQGSGKAAPPACLALRTPSLARRRRYHHHSDRSGGDKEASRDLSSRAGPGAWRWPWPHCGVCPAIS